MFKLETKEFDKALPWIYYTYTNEQGFELMITYDYSKEFYRLSRFQIVLTNKGVPIPGDPSLSFSGGNLTFNISRPISCDVKNISKLKDKLDLFDKMSEEISKIIKDIETENAR